RAHAAGAGLSRRRVRGRRRAALAARPGAAGAGTGQRAGRVARLAGAGLARARVNPLVTIFLRFAVLSLIAVGGVTSILPEVHRVTVDVHHWLTDAEFTQMFAI